MNIIKLLLVFLSLTTERFVAARDVTLPMKSEPRFFFHQKTCKRKGVKGWCTSSRKCKEEGGTVSGGCFWFRKCCIKATTTTTTTTLRPIFIHPPDNLQILSFKPVPPSENVQFIVNPVRPSNNEHTIDFNPVRPSENVQLIVNPVSPSHNVHTINLNPVNPSHNIHTINFNPVSPSHNVHIINLKPVSPSHNVHTINLKPVRPFENMHTINLKPVTENVEKLVSIGASNVLILKRETSECCQLRIDFLEFSVGQIDTEGKCTAGIWEIAGCKTDVNPPVLCGENSGQHMYVSFFGDEPIEIRIKGLTERDKLKIKTTRIKCNDQNKAPDGCLQLFNETTGEVKSFGFQNRVPKTSETFQLANMNYKVCIGIKGQFLAVKWSGAKYAHNFFTITGNAELSQAILGDVSSCTMGKNCLTDFVYIPDGNFIIQDQKYRASKFCGLGFPDKVSTSSTELQVVTNDVELRDRDGGNAGFCLQYQAI